MKIRNITDRFFFGMKKAAVFEAGTEGQAGTDKKSPGVLFFDVRRNQCRFTITKREPGRNLVANHRNLLLPPAHGRGLLL
jgi:hypothetical protein